MRMHPIQVVEAIEVAVPFVMFLLVVWAIMHFMKDNTK